MSHRIGIGVSVGQGGQKKKRREINIPSVVGGKEVSQRKAVEAFFGTGKEGMLNRALGRKKTSSRKNITKSFGNVKEAEAASKKRSAAFKPKKKRK